LGWGIYDVTLVDNGRVSHSNPARQSLFLFEDIGKEKAIQAAERLKAIFPNMNARGYCFDIPMPGHPLPGSVGSGRDSIIDHVKENLDLLSGLIQEHTVIFLLTDSLESRWLPTLLSRVLPVKSGPRLVITIGLGFDSFVVMRHGSDENKLGCYFCQDVNVNPSNTTKDRSLDQQCTISRPGLSMIASALGVEMMVSTLVHPNGPNAPAEQDQDLSRRNTSTELGITPQQIRGSLGHYHQAIGRVDSSPRCSACSPAVQAAFKTKGVEWIMSLMDDPGLLSQELEQSPGTKDVETLSLESV
jgi:ubiquitin-like modifier-activating enzyme ATG7